MRCRRVKWTSFRSSWNMIVIISDIDSTASMTLWAVNVLCNHEIVGNIMHDPGIKCLYCKSLLSKYRENIESEHWKHMDTLSDKKQNKQTKIKTLLNRTARPRLNLVHSTTTWKAHKKTWLCPLVYYQNSVPLSQSTVHLVWQSVTTVDSKKQLIWLRTSYRSQKKFLQTALIANSLKPNCV